ncbi:MAG TPA: hypothetical protein VK465_00935 [Fibrobacteria bacterium]|nr:hypothetical protein [Fibrobacteria bacterium]
MKNRIPAARHRAARAALLGACLAAAAWSHPVDISGVVRDSASGAPLPGVVVTLTIPGLADTTDEAGRFHLFRSAVRLADKAPLQRLVFSRLHGFSLRLTRPEEVTAEIRNGAGRALVHGTFSLAAGDWSLRPKNLEPGLYTVTLWTGSRLRALRLSIPNSDKARGNPEWVLTELDQAAAAAALAPPFGVAVDSLRLTPEGYAPSAVGVQSWSQGGITVLPRRLVQATP